MDIQREKLTILMLDHEPLLIDRRIILEGKTLVEAGYKVYLATRGDAIKKSIEESYGIEVRRFSDPLDEALANPLSPEGRRESARRKIAMWISSGGNPGLEKKIRGKNPGILNSIAYAWLWPPALAHVLRRRYPKVKNIMGRLFEPALYALMLRPDFIRPYFALIKYYTANLLNRKTDRISLADDSWQSRLYKFAIDLQPDFVHAHDLPNLKLGCLIAKNVNASLIYDAHELYPLQHFSDERKRRNLLDLERSLIGRADAIITINRQCVDILKNEYGVENLVAVTNATEAPAGFDPRVQIKKWHEQFSLPGDVKIIVFQGGINPVRNIDPLVEALVYCDPKIHIGFITYKNDIPYYDEMARSLNIEHRIHYVVEIPWDEVNSWVASADAGIMPYQVTSKNTQISSPNKLYEFVVAGLPIMASNELINVEQAIKVDGLGVTTTLKGVDTYVALIKAMFDHPEGPGRFKKNVLAARPKYLWSSEAPKIVACYDDLLKIRLAKQLNSLGQEAHCSAT